MTDSRNLTIDKLKAAIKIVSEPPKGTPYARIQWKGTEACMDIYCKCGEEFHLDGEYLYEVQCPRCSQSYLTGDRITLTPIND